MKNVSLLALIITLTAISCTKTSHADMASDFTNDNTNITAYSTLIVGKWQLTEIGKKPCSATCFMKETTWVKSTTSTLLDFKATGEFTKNGFCTSKFSITNEGHLATQSDCLVEKFITRLTHTELVLDAPDRTTCYKYARL